MIEGIRIFAGGPAGGEVPVWMIAYEHSPVGYGGMARRTQSPPNAAGLFWPR
jgi:hypothetical protein